MAAMIGIGVELWNAAIRKKTTVTSAPNIAWDDGDVMTWDDGSTLTWDS